MRAWLRETIEYLFLLNCGVAIGIIFCLACEILRVWTP